jgi:hypothetical protein
MTILKMTIVGLAAAVACLAGCGEASRASAGESPAVMPAAAKAVGPWRDYRGVAMQITQPDPLGVYVPLLREIAELGADSVLISPAAYMEHARAQAIFIDALKTPAPDEFAMLLREARKLGLRVLFMPIVLLKYPRGSEWRGVIEPPSWDDWWRDYREFVSYFADIAQAGEADAFMVGSELVSTEKYTSEWIRVVELCRDRFKGKLGYSANWDHYEPVKIWDKLDFIGMTSYYTLADKKNPSIDEIAKRWDPIRENILKWARKTGKPLVLTEVGWCSQEGAAMAPWNYYQNQSASPAGLEEQRRLYEGFLKAWDGAAGLGGVFWWEWSSATGGESDFNYTPRKKPAEAVIRRWFAERRGTGASAQER